MIHLHGAILRGLYAAGESIRLLMPEQHQQGFQYDPGKWYDCDELERLIRLFNRYSHPDAVLERLGEEMMHAWYRDGPGRQFAPSAVEFLRFQSGSNGYRSVVQGPVAATGDFLLEQLDEARGEALLRSTTIFDAHLELGILQGGLDAAGDLLFSEVQLLPDREHYQIRFVTPTNHAGIAWAPARSADEWQLRQRIARLEQRERFWHGINETLNQAFRDMQQRATVDPLTGLWTRDEFARRLQVEHARALRHQRPLSVLYLDVDRFKSINDIHGHGAGDALLAAFGRACLALVRLPDVAGRQGGDEFAVVLPESPLQRAQTVARRIGEMARRLRVPFGDDELRLSVSIGVAELAPGASTEALLDAADTQLLAAKAAGRDRFHPPAAQS